MTTPPIRITAHIRRLSAETDSTLYVRFSFAEIQPSGLTHDLPIRVTLDSRVTIVGVLKLTADNPWLSPGPDNSNADVSATIVRAGLKLGEDVPAIIEPVQQPVPAKDWSKPWTIEFSRERMHEFSREPSFHCLMRLARHVNALRFAQIALADADEREDRPVSYRARPSAFIYTGSVLVEGLALIPELRTHFATNPHWRRSFGRFGSDEDVRALYAQGSDLCGAMLFANSPHAAATSTPAITIDGRLRIAFRLAMSALRKRMRWQRYEQLAAA